jgi:hypothetical protein
VSRCELLCKIATGQTELRGSARQLHISSEGDSYLRMVLVQGAQHIGEPFGKDSDLRRRGLKLAERAASTLNPQPRSSVRQEQTLLYPLDLRHYLTSKGIEMEALCAPLVAVTTTL